MKNIRLFTKWLCSVMTLLAVSLPTQAQMSPGEQIAVHEVDGHISFKIETKTLSMSDAQAALNKPITLKVSIIMRGGWVALLDKGFQVRFNPNSFSFGITQRTGANAPFYKDNPPAYIGAHYSLASKCLMDDGNPLIAEASNMYIAAPGWNQNKETNHCPIYDYGTGLDNRSNFNSDSYRHRGTDEDGDYYEIDLFPITLKLKRIESVYVRGIDDAGTFVTDSPTDLYATSGTTELNLINLTTDATLYWPGAPKQDGEEHPESADWTLAPKDYYGGVIPGGIFIEQVPELTQFERSSMA